jgi:hypothetical protein
MSDKWPCKVPHCGKAVNNGMSLCAPHQKRRCPCGKEFRMTMKSTQSCSKCASAKRRAERRVG